MSASAKPARPPGVPEGWGAPHAPVMTFPNGTAKASSSASKTGPAMPSPPTPRMIPAVPTPTAGPTAAGPEVRPAARASEKRDAGVLKIRKTDYPVRVLRPYGTTSDYFIVHVPSLDAGGRLAVRIVQQKSPGVFALPTVATALDLAKRVGSASGVKKFSWKAEQAKFVKGKTTIDDIADGKICIYVGEDIATNKAGAGERRSEAKKLKEAKDTEETGEAGESNVIASGKTKKPGAKKPGAKKLKAVNPKEALARRLDQIDRERGRQAKTSAVRVVLAEEEKEEDLFGDSADGSAGLHGDGEDGDYGAMEDSEAEPEAEPEDAEQNSEAEPEAEPEDAERNSEADEVESINSAEEAMLVDAMEKEATRSDLKRPATAERKRKLQALADGASRKRLRKSKPGRGLVLSQAEDSEDSEGSEGSDDSAGSLDSFIDDGSVEDEQGASPLPAFASVPTMPPLPPLDSVLATVAQESVAEAPRQVTASTILRSLAGLIGLCADYFDRK